VNDAQIEELKNLTGAQEGDTIFFQADTRDNVTKRLGALRNKLIADFELLKGKEDEVSFALIVDFPLYEVGDDG
jgi:aspartyl-tRNA synthetase